MTSERQYRYMCREAVCMLEFAWGKEKFQEWYEEIIIPLNGKIYLDYHGYYTMLKAELDGLYQMYDRIFRNQYEEEIAMAHDWADQQIQERPF